MGDIPVPSLVALNLGGIPNELELGGICTLRASNKLMEAGKPEPFHCLLGPFFTNGGTANIAVELEELLL